MTLRAREQQTTAILHTTLDSVSAQLRSVPPRAARTTRLPHCHCLNLKCVLTRFKEKDHHNSVNQQDVGSESPDPIRLLLKGFGTNCLSPDVHLVK